MAPVAVLISLRVRQPASIAFLMVESDTAAQRQIYMEDTEYNALRHIYDEGLILEGLLDGITIMF